MDHFKLNSIKDAVNDFKEGKFVIVVDDANRENEGDLIFAAVERMPGVECDSIEGAFYAFPDISWAFGKSHGGTKIGNDVDFCNALLEAKGVACVPGSAFGDPDALRISYTCPTAQLPEGLKRFREFFAELQ